MVNRLCKDLMQTLRTNYVDGYIKTLSAMIDIFFTKLTKLCVLGCHISQPASEGSPVESSGAPVRGLFHKMHGKELFTISYQLGIRTDCQ